jgi:hypothetical protein
MAGRPKGSSQYSSDRQLWRQMAELVATGKAKDHHAAARMLAPQAGGRGKERSRVLRLEKGYKANERALSLEWQAKVLRDIEGEPAGTIEQIVRRATEDPEAFKLQLRREAEAARVDQEVFKLQVRHEVDEWLRRETLETLRLSELMCRLRGN